MRIIVLLLRRVRRAGWSADDQCPRAVLAEQNHSYCEQQRDQCRTGGVAPYRMTQRLFVGAQKKH
jgi:hypothetical protein